MPCSSPSSSRRAPLIRAAVVAASAAAALVTAVPAAAPTTSTPTTSTATPLAGPPAPAAPPAIAANPLFPPPAPAPVAAPVPTVTLPVEPVAQAVPTAGSGSAMNRALSKVGAPYRWGAAGPNAFDCSGLVSWAYKGSGLSLPRTSQAMSRIGTPVSRASLRPGDLVFFYRPVSHVGIYIGNGQIVHASSRKSPVKVSDMGRMKFNSARRV